MMFQFWRKPGNGKTQPDQKPDQNWNIDNLDLSRLPVLSRDDLVDTLGIAPKLKSIEKLTGAGSEYFTLLYRPALDRYIESVQLVPASAAHHHAGPGGLLLHTLDVIDIALRQRKSYNLPQRSAPEIIAQQEHVWTYAVFAGAMLHDIGKLVCNTVIRLESGTTWTPHGNGLSDTGATHYSVSFLRSHYSQHTRLSNGFLHLLPADARGWLSQYPDILSQLSAWLAGDYYEWGVIGDIVRQADMESVAANLKLGGDRKRFPNAPNIPLVDKLTTALRQLLDDGTLKINRADGSAGWCDGPYTYLVCGTAANAVRQQLHSTGATDIPVDNTRIFDTWQEHGFVESTPDGQAIWHLDIDDGRLHLTVLKFETNRLFHPSRRPVEYPGKLTLADQKPEMNPTGGTATTPESSNPTGGTATTPESPNLTAGPSSTPESSNPTVGTANTPESSNLTVGPSNTPESPNLTVGPSNTPESPNLTVGPSNTPVPPNPTVGTANTPESSNLTGGPSTTPEHQNLTGGPSTTPGISKRSFFEKHEGKQSDDNHVKNFYMADTGLNDAELAQHFLDWLKDGIRHHRIFVNRADALVHVVKEGALIISPLSFKTFARHFSLVDSSGADKNQAEDKAAVKIQKQLERMMRKRKLHRKTKRGTNIHTYLVQGEHKEAKVRGWLLPASEIFGDSPPPPNDALSNISGFFEPRPKKNSAHFLSMEEN